VWDIVGNDGASSDEGDFVLTALSFGEWRCNVATSSWWLGSGEACVFVELWLRSMSQSDQPELFFFSFELGFSVHIDAPNQSTEVVSVYFYPIWTSSAF
jgi:hypothetical protein